MDLHPQGVNGNWRAGIILDWHTVSSMCVGENEFGHPIFETTRSDIGELLYRFKYKGDAGALTALLETACKYLEEVRGKFDVVVPVPPSNPTRVVTRRLAEGIAKCINAAYLEDGLKKSGSTEELKRVSDPEQRKKILENAFQASPDRMRDSKVLLVDDLYRSGATLEAATKAAYEDGDAKHVYVFAVTRTRVHR